MSHTDIALGLGEWIIGHCIYEGTPAIIFTPAPTPGIPNTSADGVIPTDRLADGAVVMRFVTPDAAYRHLERLRMMVETYESWVRK